MEIKCEEFLDALSMHEVIGTRVFLLVSIDQSGRMFEQLSLEFAKYDLLLRLSVPLNRVVLGLAFMLQRVACLIQYI